MENKYILGNKKLLILIILITSILSLSIISAADNVSKSTNKTIINDSKKVVPVKNDTVVKKVVNKPAVVKPKYVTYSKSKKSYGHRYVKYNKYELISKTKCSCGSKSYKKFYVTKFKNYCPFCKKTGVMKYRNHYEGEWTCKRCGADFCCAEGKEKLKKPRKYLVKK